MSANIRPSVQPHSACCRQDWMKPMGVPGDVRRCSHDHIQLLTKTPDYARVQGPGTHWWKTLSPIFNPIDYRKAKRALTPNRPPIIQTYGRKSE